MIWLCGASSREEINQGWLDLDQIRFLFEFEQPMLKWSFWCLSPLGSVLDRIRMCYWLCICIWPVSSEARVGSRRCTCVLLTQPFKDALIWTRKLHLRAGFCLLITQQNPMQLVSTFKVRIKLPSSKCPKLKKAIIFFVFLNISSLLLIFGKHQIVWKPCHTQKESLSLVRNLVRLFY